MLMCVGAALRVGEAYSLRWRDCTVIRLGDKDETEAVRLRVLGKHARGGSVRTVTACSARCQHSRR
jgi:hypothetical protein